MTSGRIGRSLTWFGVVRLGLVQTALGAIVVLTQSTLNRIMVVELALPAVLPAFLVGLYYAIQLLRPKWGHGADLGGRRTAWIIGGMAVLALSGFAAAVATVLMEWSLFWGTLLGVVAFLFIGVGSGAAGTSLLTLLASEVAPERRAAAASITWMMMIAGFIVATALAGQLLDPYSSGRLLLVSGGISVVAFLLALIAVWGLEGERALAADAKPKPKTAFIAALGDVLKDDRARRFTIFVFLSMLAYSMQDLILEPYGGLVFAMTPGETTQLASFQHGGVLTGMLLVAVAASRFGAVGFGCRQGWVIGGCLLSAVALALLVVGGQVGLDWPLRANIFLLGLGNGAFAVAAIGQMMGLAGEGRERSEGTRMGLWGAAQAIAFGVGGFFGALSLDLARLVFDSPTPAFAVVFTGEALLFILAAILASRIGRDRQQGDPVESLALPAK